MQIKKRKSKLQLPQQQGKGRVAALRLTGAARILLRCVLPAADEEPVERRRGHLTVELSASPPHRLGIALAERDAAVRLIRVPFVARHVEGKVDETRLPSENGRPPRIFGTGMGLERVN